MNPYFDLPDRETPEQRDEKFGFISRITAMLQAYQSDIDIREDLVVPSVEEVLTRLGKRDPIFGAMSQLYGVSTDDYRRAVDDCRKLAERNPVFSAIRRKLTRTIAEVPSTVKFMDPSPQSAQADEVIESLLTRTQWNDKKEEFYGRMLDEGGLSLEIIMSNRRRSIDRIEYRPHDTIHRLVDSQGAFQDATKAYQQIDARTGTVIATFHAWQIADVNLEESAYHNRGIPHLQAARQTLDFVGLMIKGLMQRWVREGGSIEHFNLEDSRHWTDVEEFKRENQQALNAAPDSLVRQIISRGKMNVQRIFADASAQDASAIEFMLELVFMAAGVSKELLGFKSHVVIRDMVEIAQSNYYQNLNKIQARGHSTLAKVIDLELLLNGIIPESVPYVIEGGRFELVEAVSIPKEVLATSFVSPNEVRRSCNLPPMADPLWDIPGYVNTPAAVIKMAREAGLDITGAGTQDPRGTVAPGGSSEPGSESAAIASPAAPPKTDAATTADYPEPPALGAPRGKKRRVQAMVDSLFRRDRIPPSVAAMSAVFNRPPRV